MGSAASQNGVEKKETEKGSVNSVNKPVSLKGRAKSVKEAIKTIQTIKSFFDNNGELLDDKWDAISYLLDVSKFLQRITSQEEVKQTSEIADMLIKENIVEVMCELLYIVYDGEITDFKSTAVSLKTLRSIKAFTACSEKFCKAICRNPWFLDTMKNVLENSNDGAVLEVVLVLRNIILRESCVRYVRQVEDITKTLTSFLKSNTVNDIDRIWTIAILAAIVTDDELAKTNADDKTLRNGLVKPFRECLGKEGLMSKHCSCTDLTIIIRMLARNKDNNQHLVNVNCLELLVEFEKKANTKIATLECVKAILALASDAGNRKTMVTDSKLGVIDRLVQLKKSESHAAKDIKKETAVDKDLKKNCDVVLFTLRDELQRSEKYKRLGASYYMNNEKNIEKSDGEHIMISYQWDNQKELEKIRDRLKAAGHKVWMDIDEMGGSTIQAMAGAVENAKIVLICITKKYEDSTNCQAEAEYAWGLKKCIIPLKLERDYQPRDWVGIIVGAKLYHEFTDKYPFETRMAGLLRNVAKVTQEQGPTLSKSMVSVPGSLTSLPSTTEAETHSERVTPQPTMEFTSLSSVAEADTQTTIIIPEPTIALGPSNETQMTCRFTLESVRRWTSTDVQAWIESNDLQECNIDDRTGFEIALFVTLSTEPNYYFCRCLKKMWDVRDTVILSKLVWAFNDLAIELNKSTILSKAVLNESALVHRVDRNENTRFSRVGLNESNMSPRVN